MTVDELVDALRVEASYLDRTTNGAIFKQAADVLTKQQMELRALRRALHHANQRRYQQDNLIDLMTTHRPFTTVEVARLQAQARGEL